MSTLPIISLRLYEAIYGLETNVPADFVPDAEDLYLNACRDRLVVILGDSLSVTEAAALACLLAYEEFRFSDGFVISDDMSENTFTTIGHRAASWLAKSLCADSSVDSSDIWEEYSNHRKARNLMWVIDTMRTKLDPNCTTDELENSRVRLPNAWTRLWDLFRK